MTMTIHRDDGDHEDISDNYDNDDGDEEDNDDYGDGDYAECDGDN
jgi:hypothetical protein